MTAITMSPEAVHAAIQGFALNTFYGWTKAAEALLKDKPERTALKHADDSGFMVLVDGALIAVPVNRDGSLTYAMEGDCPEGSCDPDANAWDSARGYWDCDEPHVSLATITTPVFVTLTYAE